MKKTNQELRAGRKIRVRSKNGKRTLTGYAIVFSPATSEDLGNFVEQIDPNAVNIAENNVWCLRGHDNNRQLGSTDSGTLRLSKDTRGVRFELDLPDTTDGNDLEALYSNGSSLGGLCSFGFVARADEWSQRPDGSMLRTVTDLQLFEISVGVVFPAYHDTTAALRSMPASLRAKLKRSDSDEQQVTNDTDDDNDGDMSCRCEDPTLRCIRCDSSADDCTCGDDSQLRCERCLRDYDPADDDDDDVCDPDSPDYDADACEDRNTRSLLVATLIKRRSLLYT